MITTFYICFLFVIQSQAHPINDPVISVIRESYWEGNSKYDFYSNGKVVITNTKWDGKNEVIHRDKIDTNKINRLIDTLVQIGLLESTNLSIQRQFERIEKETGQHTSILDARNYHIIICKAPVFFDAQQKAPRRYAEKYKSIKEFQVFSKAVDLFEIFIENNNFSRFGPDRKKHRADID